MDNRQIQYFMEVAKQGSFSKAAEQLFVSQPTISNVVKNIENELGVQLLARTTRKLELTDTGQLLYEYGQQISQLYQHFYQELDDITNVQNGSIKMGIFSSIGTNILTDILSDFHKQYPNILIHFVEDGEQNLQKALLDGDLDLVIQEIPTDEPMNYIPFLSGELRLLVHHTHHLASKEGVKWGELKDEHFISFRQGFAIRQYITQECEKVGFKPKIICETAQWKFIFEMVSRNMGIAILPESELNKLKVAHMGINVLPFIDEIIHWQIGIAWKKDGYISHAARTWIQFLKTRLEQLETSKNDLEPGTHS
ncbi:LysR family transcriptional regulator [Psychrobacillus sp. NPDC096426]|uniref:LysR family transcriptional regulator n=1 Tax=Psychrobacillus sp. NPDC096426 TaxID=3364491 RepID=UPI0037F5061B